MKNKKYFSITLKLIESDKIKFNEYCKEKGTNPSNVLRIFIKTLIETK